VGGDPLKKKFSAILTLLGQSIFARSASGVTSSEKIQLINTNRKSTTRLPLSLRWTSYVTPKPSKGAQKQNGRFSSKITLHCYKVSLCENHHWQSCTVFTGLSIRAKMVRGGRPLLRENFAETPIFNQYSLTAPQPYHLAKKVQLTWIGSPLLAFQ